MNIKKIDAWWFVNSQKKEDILQSDWFTPRTHFAVYADFEEKLIPCPLLICIQAKTNSGITILEKKYHIENFADTEEYDIYVKGTQILLKGFMHDTRYTPDELEIVLQSGTSIYRKNIAVSFVEISGKITDFSNKPFPAPVILQRQLFGGKRAYIGVWSNHRGEYKIKVPTGLYQSFYVDDNSYGVSSLECWGWNMLVDKNETHHFKIGNGEVYDLKVFADKADHTDLWCDFRPMVLPSIRKDESEIIINDKKYTLLNCQPDITENDLAIFINENRVKITSLETKYEFVQDRNANYALIRYLVKVKNTEKAVKQLIRLEYQTTGKYKSSAQGRTHFMICE